MFVNKNIFSSYTLLLLSALLVGCGNPNPAENSTAEEFKHADLVTKKVNGDAYTYIFELNTDVDSSIEPELKKMSQGLVQSIIRETSIREPIVAVYFFDQGRSLPDLSRYFPGHVALTDYMYAGEHEAWSYIYMQPLIGDVVWTSCKESENNFCK